MNRSRLVLWLFIFFESFVSLLYAQQGPQLVKITPPSPSAVAFQKYGDIPVSNYTGIPNISIPIYTIKSHDITVPISLSYHAGGIKVSEEATQVGLGWVLNASGQISRNIVGGDDFIDNYLNGFSNQLTTWSDGRGPTNTVQTGCIVPMFNKNDRYLPSTYTDTLTNYLTANPVYDFQPDQFYYHFADRNGKFILKRNREVILQKQEKIDIKCLADDGSSWRITTEDGYKYDFTAYETFHDNEYTTSGVPQTHKSTWYLTKITSVTGNTITFQYKTLINYVRSVGSYSETREDWAGNSKNLSSYPAVWQKGFTPGKEYSTLVLSSIAFDNGNVLFNYSDNRLDLPGDLRLDSITVLDKTKAMPLKNFVFDYDYFNGIVDPSFNNTGTVSNAIALRLKLKSITEKGNGNSLYNGAPYRFEYNEMNNNLPAKTSFARDHWGYYNGVTGRSTLIPDFLLLANSFDAIAYYLGVPGTQREPNANWSQAFVLKRITYPTGGASEFQYEQNEFDEKNSIINDHSYFSTVATPVQRTKSLLYDAVYKTYGQTGDTLDLTNLYKTTDLLGNSSYLPVSLTGVFRFSGNCSDIQLNQIDQLYFDLYDLNGTRVMHVDPASIGLCNTPANQTAACISCQTNSPVLSYSITYPLSPGKYIWKVYVASTGYPVTLQDVRANYSWYESAGTGTNSGTNTISQGGGLRILRIVDHDQLNESNNIVRKYNYRYKKYDSSSNSVLDYSYGRRMTKPQYSYFDVSMDNYSQALSGGCVSTTYWTMHLMRSSDSEMPLNGSAGGAVVGYDQVEELFGENGENGKNEYRYINLPDAVIPYNEIFSGANLPVRPPTGSTVPNLNNGLLLSKKSYRRIAAGSFIKTNEVIHTYNDINDGRSSNLVYGLENRVLSFYNGGDQCSGIMPPQPCTNNMLLTFTSLKSDRSYLVSTTDRTYDQSDSTRYNEAVTNFYYDNPVHLQLTRSITKNSKGEVLTTTVHYPLDYSFTSPAGNAMAKAILNLQNNHLVSVPVERFTQLSNTDGSNLRTNNAVFTAYDTALLLPSAIYKVDNAAPMTDFIPAQVVAGSVTIDSRYHPYVNINQYDTAGNILQQQKVNDVYHAYIWDYSNTWPVAEVVNATAADIAYTSFESTGNGNWQGVIATNVQTGSAVPTGNKYYTFSGSTLSVGGLNTGTKYMVSYWSNAGPCTVTGTTNTTSGRQSGSWTYYEHEVTGVSNAAITGNGSIDELRLCPKASQMTTYTFDPLLGMTSACDASGKITYYEYDGLGRLFLVRDQDRNILKHLCYTFNGQLSPCYLVYISAEIKKAFQKNNCTAGGVGSTITYTVAAGTYSSVISQDDANQKALNDANTNGQAYANTNGTCTYPVTTYYNTQQSGSFTRNNCAAGGTGSTVVYTVAAGAYSSANSQADADQKALNDVNTNGQTYAKTNGTCTFYNVMQSGNFTKNNCPNGGLGSSVTYTVAAGTYNSTISQADADQKAINDVNTNGQTYANTNGTCMAQPMIDVTYLNSTTDAAYISLTNTATNVVYNFTLQPLSPNGTVAGQIPQGNYNVTMTSSNGTSMYSYGIYTFDATNVFNTTFYNVPLSCTKCAVARVY